MEDLEGTGRRMQGMDEGYVVEAGRGTGGVPALWRHRGLLWSLTLRETQVRYRQALLGVLWAVLQPLALMLVTTVVFHRVLRVDVGGVPYPLFVFAGLVPWAFFHTAVSAAVPSLVSNADLVRKIWFPREALPLAGVLAVLLDLGAGIVLWVAMLLLAHVPLSAALLCLPVLLAILLATTMAWALLGSAVNVYFRDVKHALPLLLQVVFFATPIVYPLSKVPPVWQPWIRANPLTAVVEGMRAVGLEGRLPPLDLVAVGAVGALLSLGLAYAVFLRAQRRFADVV